MTSDEKKAGGYRDLLGFCQNGVARELHDDLDELRRMLNSLRRKLASR